MKASVSGKESMAKRVALWLVLIASVVAALWCSNLVIFHMWAADVPPYETAQHIRSAKLSVVAVIAFLAVGFLCIRKLCQIAEDRRKSAA